MRSRTAESGLYPGFPFCLSGWHRYTPDRRRAHEILFVAQASRSRDCHSARADVRPTGAAVFRAFLRHWSTRAPFLRRSSAISGRPLSSRHWQRPEALVHESELARNDPHPEAPHLPISYDSGPPRSVIRFRMLHASSASALCPPGVRARRPVPMIDLYLKKAFSTRACRW